MARYGAWATIIRGNLAATQRPFAPVLFSSLQQAFVNLRRGRPGQLPPPRAAFERELQPPEQTLLQSALACSVVGSPETVRRGIASFAQRTGADELMVTPQVYDHAARLRSFEITCAVAAS